MKKIFFIVLASILLLPFVASATVIIDRNGSSISYGISWDSPPMQVEQVLTGLDSEFSGDVNLTLVNGFGSSDIDSWFGSGVVSIILEELAGYKNNTTFGWYDTNDLINSGQIFSGSNSMGASSTVNFGGVMDFGFYIDPNGSTSNRMYTENENNTENDYQVAIFKIEEYENQYILGWEDLDLNGGAGGDRDYQDMIVRITVNKIPEPTGLALMALGMVALGLSRRKRNS